MIFLSKGRPPDFIIIGAQKSGTSSLYADLIQHPEVAKKKRKELHFFDNGYEEGIDNYLKNFRRGLFERKKLIRGEATPYYFFHPLVPERISQNLSHVKFILILRDPIQRAISHFRMNKTRGIESRTFKQAIECEIQIIAQEENKLLTHEIKRSVVHQTYSYISRGFYAEQLQRWLSLFNMESILVLFFEEYFSNQEIEFQRICKFLDIMDYKPDVSFLNVAKDKNIGLDKSEEIMLKDLFHISNKKLFQILGTKNIWGY